MLAALRPCPVPSFACTAAQAKLTTERGGRPVKTTPVNCLEQEDQWRHQF
jgi:hypothetical protein